MTIELWPGRIREKTFSSSEEDGFTTSKCGSNGIILIGELDRGLSWQDRRVLAGYIGCPFVQARYKTDSILMQIKSIYLKNQTAIEQVRVGRNPDIAGE